MALTYAFFRAGMIEAWGRGIRRIATACENAGNPAPEGKIEPGSGLWLEFRYSVAFRAAVPWQAAPPERGPVRPELDGKTEEETEAPR